jgi:hypothetical protein
MTFNHPAPGAVPDASSISRKFRSHPLHRTAIYRAKKAYAGMLKRCGNADGRNPTYVAVELRMGIDEWLEWAVPRYELFIQQNPEVSPAAARPGDLGHYEIGNMEIISAAQNSSQRRSPSALRADGTKRCSRCKEIKDAASFSSHRGACDGLNHWCRSCCSIYYAGKPRIRSSAARTRNS